MDENRFAHLPPTWQECIEQFLIRVQDRSGSKDSRKTYHTILKRFSAFIAPRGLADATRADVRAYIQAPGGGGRNRGGEISASAKNTRATVLAGLYKFASDFEIAGPDGEPTTLYQKALPTLGHKWLKIGTPYRAMSTSETQRLFAAIPTDTVMGARDFALLLFYFVSLRRRAEICKIVWGEIEQVTFYEQGIERTGYQYRYHGKGASRTTRVAELPEQCYRAIVCYLQMAGRLDSMQPDTPVFVSLRAHRIMPLNLNTANRIFKRYAAAAQLPLERLSLHSLRHSGARERELSGQSIIEISEALNHSNLGTTMLYLRRNSPVADKGIALLSKRLPFLSQPGGMPR